MDTFMDKLAQKLTAQEMIKANTAADAEELGRLKSQVKEYNECLAQMEKVNRDMARMNQEMQAVVQRLDSLMDDTIEPRMNSLVDDTIAPRINSLVDEKIAPQVDRLMDSTVAPHIDRLLTDGVTPRIERLVDAAVDRLEEAKVDGSQIDRLTQDAIEKIQAIAQDREALEQLGQMLKERLEQTDEYVHKENVKVYRNVQAVVVEESGRQKEAVEGASKDVAAKLKTVIGISIAALAAAAGGLVLQLLVCFHII